MIRSPLITLTTPLCLILAACAGGPPTETATATATETDTDDTTTSDTTTQGTTTLTTSATATTTTMGTTATTTTTTTTTTMSTTMETTTGPMPECDAADGMPDDKCDAATPFCYAGDCVDCQGAMNPGACAGIDPGTPVCTNEGTCVQCTADDAAACTGTSPVCDDATNTCTGCTEHAQCAETACNVVDGSCFSADYVIYVDKGAADCMVGDGTMAAPFCTLAEAFTKIAEPDNLPAAWTVKIKLGTYTAMENITPAGSTIALIADGGPVIIRSNADGAAGLTTGDGSTLFTSGIVFSLSDGSGLKCSASTVYAADTQMKSNAMQGIESIDCSTYIKRGLITSNTKGGIAAYGPGVTEIVNSHVNVNGNAGSEFGGVRSAQGNELKILFSSVISNDGNQVASVQCIEGTSAEIRNSVVIGRTNNPSVDCPAAIISYSVVDSGDQQGDGNMIGADSDVKTWFENPVGGVFRVKALVDDLPSPIAAVAMWMAGDPRWDYDGDPRMATEGAADFPGADVPAP